MNSPVAQKPTRAVEYVRMSTQNQKYSISHQSAANHLYAAQRGMEITKTYADRGISGLTFEKRTALKQLIHDVQSQTVDFSDIIVYDVSRWGRFQDCDESGHYEYICKLAGVRVHYCAEQFENDGTPFAAILKSIKRTMAGEYSRDLSAKVFGAQARLVEFGYSQGGEAGFGLRRLLVDPSGTPKQVLQRGERKNIATDRTILIPGPREETEIVKWIFEAFAKDKKGLTAIARDLNKRGIPSIAGRSWRLNLVKRVLKNERYAGNYVWNHRSTKLKGPAVHNPPDKWLRADAVIEPVVDPKLFATAQEIIRRRALELTQEEKLAPLRRLLRKHGRLSCAIISNDKSGPTLSTYRRWFGGLRRAYELVGFEKYRRWGKGPGPYRSDCRATFHLSNDEALEHLHEVLKKHGCLSRKLINETVGIPSADTYWRRFGGVRQLYQLLAHLPEHPANSTDELPDRRHHTIAYNLSDEQMLTVLRGVLEKYGRLSTKIINESRTVPCAFTYANRFGCLSRAYELIGYHRARKLQARGNLGRWVAKSA
jgi:DNA invertase Pin-like site-specific DNA recombinase